MDTEEEVVDTEQHEEMASDQQVQPESVRVPLEALEAERRKRQDLAAENKLLREMMNHRSAAINQPESDDDEDDFITKKDIKASLASQKRELLEEAYVDAKPEVVAMIEKHLDGILQKRPWLKDSIASAPNRYARAYEIIQDYTSTAQPPSVQKMNDGKEAAKRIVENSKKPGSPAAISKSSTQSNADYLRSIAGKSEFREYRKNLLAGKN